MPNLHLVFVNGPTAQVLPESINGSEFWGLVNKGWALVWDSAPSVEAGFNYAADEYHATEDHGHGICCHCKETTAAGLFVGKKWNYDWERFYPYRGHLCEQCADSSGVYEGRFVQTH